MNDFDRFLVLELRQMLDPVVATPAPSRRRRRPDARPSIVLSVEAAPIELAPEAISVDEPIVATVPVAGPVAVTVPVAAPPL